MKESFRLNKSDIEDGGDAEGPEASAAESTVINGECINLNVRRQGDEVVGARAWHQLGDI